MARLLSKRRLTDALFALAVGLTVLALMLFPAQAVDAAKGGVELCLNVIVPSLFPFFVLSTLCVELGLMQALGRLLQAWMYPLFRVGGVCASAFLLGIIGGYPVGARTAISLYKKGLCSKAETERLLSFCNNSGPAFILGVVGAGVFGSSRVGLLLYGAHVLASVLVGLVFRCYGRDEPLGRRLPPAVPRPGFSAVFTGSVKSALQATFNICGFVIFFTVLIRLLFLTGVMTGAAKTLALLLGRFGLEEPLAESLLTGAVEMSSGVWSLSAAAGSMSETLCMAAFILGWAGLSVHCQVLSFIGSTGLSTKTYFFGKLLHGVFSAGLIFLCAAVFQLDAPVSAYLATEVSALASIRFSQALAVSTMAAAGVWLVLTVISLGGSSNRRRNRV